jgi:hypothetical protein
MATRWPSTSASSKGTEAGSLEEVGDLAGEAGEKIAAVEGIAVLETDLALGSAIHTAFTPDVRYSSAFSISCFIVLSGERTSTHRSAGISG